MKKFERLFENHNRIIVKPETAEKAATKSFILFFFLFFLVLSSKQSNLF